VDGLGNAYVTGTTSSANFPRPPAPSKPTTLATRTLRDQAERQWHALLYSTYLGSAATDDGEQIAVDGSGSAFVAGVTSSTNFPTTSSAFQTAMPVTVAPTTPS